MIGLIIAIIVYNFIAFKTNKKLTGNQIIQIWTFTVAFQIIFDVIVDYKYHGYWYFTKAIDWQGIIPHLLLVPPVNIIFLNWYPFEKKITKQFAYLVTFVLAIVIYEAIAKLPNPWGYFHNGWWTLGYSAIVDPILLLILLGFYKWICQLEIKAVNKYRQNGD
ncbi:hypothetical protein NDK43_25025 [Neobacillus pocheonensis]|uniref:Pr6Pr family membrane protein n=1 Tax=Neobacillus pocheonensis TaxID=363869 RepID=A0ABT0WFA5_9BACI|nr:hypothetical protein [Neobacillus pocheonensis]